jgi:hypothetical protein
MAQIISLHSFRGGTGKSNTTANIAALLAADGRRVGVIDTDIQSPGIHVLFGLRGPQITHALNDYLWGRCAVADIAQPVLQDAFPGRVFLIPSSIKADDIVQVIRQGYDVRRLTMAFRELIDHLQLDALLIDTHPGLNEETLFALAGVAGLAIPLLGSLSTTLAMGMASIHYALGIYNLVQERLPRPAVPADVPRPGGNRIGPAARAAPADRRAGLRAALLSKEGRFLLGVSPVVGIFLGSEWLLLAGSGSFSGTLSVIGVVVVALLALIFPVLLLAASRRKGDTVPAGVLPGLGHPLVLGGIYLLGIASLFLHGLVIWENPLARGVALLAGLLGLGLTVAAWTSPWRPMSGRYTSWSKSAARPMPAVPCT